MSKIVRDQEKQEKKQIKCVLLVYGNSCSFERIMGVVLFLFSQMQSFLTPPCSLANRHFIKVFCPEAQDPLNISSLKTQQLKLEP